MKKSLTNFTWAILGSFLLTACSQSDEFANNQTPLSQEVSLRHVSINEARNFVNVLSEDLFQRENSLRSTLQEDKVISSIEPVIQGSDTVMYIINYAEHKGYLIISGDKGSSPILAFSDNGTFDLNDLNGGVEDWVNSGKQTITEIKKQPLDSINETYEMWKDLSRKNLDLSNPVLRSIQLSIVNSIQTRNTRPNQPEDYVPQNPNEGTIVSNARSPYIPPLCVTEWGQGDPFNTYCPIVQDPNGTYQMRARVGCVAVAMGMIAHYHQYPKLWNYQIMPNKYGYEYQQNERAKMLREIGHEVGMYYEYHASFIATYYAYEIIIETFKKWGYQNPGNLIDYNPGRGINSPSLITASLKNNSPVIVLGNGTKDGHAWIIDGVETVIIYNPIRAIDTSYIFYHMNWGETGKNDGWYYTDGSDSDWLGYGKTKKFIVDIYHDGGPKLGNLSPYINR